MAGSSAEDDIRTFIDDASQSEALYVQVKSDVGSQQFAKFKAKSGRSAKEKFLASCPAMGGK
jgi:hypothetical protein